MKFFPFLPEFSRDTEELSRVAVNLAGLSEMVSPSARLQIFQDEADNRILECAVAGNAEAIVTVTGQCWHTRSTGRANNLPQGVSGSIGRWNGREDGFLHHHRLIHGDARAGFNS